MTAQLLRVGRNRWLTCDQYKRLGSADKQDAVVLGWVAPSGEGIGRHKETGKLVRVPGNWLGEGLPRIVLDEPTPTARGAPRAARRGGRSRRPEESASESQTKFIRDLVRRGGRFLDAEDEKKMRILRRKVSPVTYGTLPQPLTKREASQYIDWLRALPKDHREAGEKLADVEPGDIRQDGIYRVWNGHPYEGNVYKVVRGVHGSNRLYARKMVIEKVEEGKDKITWSYEEAVYERAITWLKHKWKLNDGEAKKLGILYGTCIRCGKTLTKEESIERKSGDTCAEHIRNGNWGRFNNQEEAVNV
ncbi:hypothetical protein A4G30_16160 [Mycobacterium kansasii]|uniref:Uncharacterized protein n=1 Tax=Mycobacterium kansasii TaxID=1768 RepID=A0A653F656_MYCKA|nr:DUF6011 domain-containing protein [Mycobacterium kansasii]ARG75776.1 hypothetical protein B1T51_16385 [Mycobacterium kansasii]ARG81315.1 hypothetical protein B1T52_16845 [Mycobacterium kansasii]ARG93404.1 hypothetical protein B1T50_17255 [Mycobacterium kansasii]KZS76310.1 hypothetical protein A4G30_16160 [Mycobacterium kansasii]VTP05083.1 hypothetical protein BIN_B_04925 [Mycobacterium kansasii]